MTIFGLDAADAKTTYHLFHHQLRERYLGSYLGMAWAILHPLLLLGTYTFVFGFVFKAKLPGAETTFAYSIWLISGFVPYLAIADAFNATANSVASNGNLVKNLVFKAELLPLAAAGTAIVPFTVGMTFLLALLALDGNWPTWHVFLLIPVAMVQFLFLTGVGFFLSATTVFLRDIAQALPTITMLILFFTPIFYSHEMLPRLARLATPLNPFFHMVTPYRMVLLEHQAPEVTSILYVGVLALVGWVFGLRVFRKLRRYFEVGL